VALAAVGIVWCAASFGICVNSFLKNARQGGSIFGAVLTVTGMLGMLSIIASGITHGRADRNGFLRTAGWAVKGLVGAMNGAQFVEMITTC
jgi:hypothetical protein